jgi:hypothetical protein
MRAGLESTVAFPKSTRICQLEPLAKLVQVMITRSSWDALTLLEGTIHAAASTPSYTAQLQQQTHLNQL